MRHVVLPVSMALTWMVLGAVPAATAQDLYTVTLRPTSPVVFEGSSTPGEVVVQRNGTSGALKVYFMLTGSATPGSSATNDYYIVTDSGTTDLGTSQVLQHEYSVTIPDGAQSCHLWVYARRDFEREGEEQVQITLTTKATYIRGPTLSAQVSIADMDALASLSTPDPVASEYFLDNSPTANTRLHFNNWELPKRFSSLLAGSATLNTDYRATWMAMHYPTAGDVTDVAVQSASQTVVYTNNSGTSFTYHLRGSGWYYNNPPTVTMPSPQEGVAVKQITAMTVAGGSGYDPANPPQFEGPPSPTYGVKAKGVGVVDASLNLTSIVITNPGWYDASELSVPISITKTGGGNPTTDAIITPLVTDVNMVVASVASMDIVSAGSGYDVNDPPYVSGPDSPTYQKPAYGFGVVSPDDGRLLGIELIDAGVYTVSELKAAHIGDNTSEKLQIDSTSPHSASAQLRGSVAMRAGIPAVVGAVINGIVISIDLPDRGLASWGSSATVSISGGGGQDAKAEIVSAATPYLRITNPGKGYRTRPDVTLTDGTYTTTVKANIAGPILLNVTNAGLGYTSDILPANVTIDPASATGVSANGVQSLTVDSSSMLSSGVWSPANANSTDFSYTVAPRETDPLAENRRSDAAGSAIWNWKTKAVDTARNANKKGSPYVEVVAGNGPLTAGDVIQIGSDAFHLYVIEAVELPQDSVRSEDSDAAIDATYMLVVSPGLIADMSNDTVVTNLVDFKGARNDVDFDLSSWSAVAYPTFDHLMIPIDDTEAEGAETMDLTLVASREWQMREPTKAQMVIADDEVTADIATIDQASEPNLSGRFRVTLSAPLPQDVTLAYSVSGSATPGNGVDDKAKGRTPDYVIAGLTEIKAPDANKSNAQAQGSITIPAGKTSADIQVAVQQDNNPESVETVTLTLQQSLDVLLKGGVNAQHNPSATVNISDLVGYAYLDKNSPYPTDGYELQGSGPSSGAFKIQVKQTGAVPQALGIRFQLSGDATYGADYLLDTSAGTDITFDPKTMQGTARIDLTKTPPEVSKVLTLQVISDALVETDETITLTLLGGSGYAVGSTDPTEVLDTTQTIVIHDDKPVLSISAVQNGQEGGSPAKFHVAYPDPARTRAIEVSYSLVTGGSDSASAADIATLSLSATIAANQTGVDITVPIIDDELAEGTEFLTLKLNALPAYGIGAGQATASIFDNEPTVNITATIADAYEGGTAGTFTVSRTGSDDKLLASPTPLTVAFTVSGTAVAGTNYKNIGTVVTIPANASSQDVTVAAKSTDKDVTVVVQLSSSTAYALGTKSATVTIHDQNTGTTPTTPTGLPSGSVADSGGGKGGGCGAGGGLAALLAMGWWYRRRRVA